MIRLLSIIQLAFAALILSAAASFASDCDSDPNECTPKKLCAIATEVTNGVTLWSASTTSSKHVNFAQELGMNCGVIELMDPCDTDPEECKINQLCEKATIDASGEKSWNNEAQGYVDVAKDYGLECEVKSDNAALDDGVCGFGDFSACTSNELCEKATTNSSKWKSTSNLYVKEAKSRGLSCGVGTTTASTPKTCSQDPKVCGTRQICALGTRWQSGEKYWETSSKYRQHAKEAKSRGLACGVKTNTKQNKVFSFKEVFKSQSNLKRKQIQYALKKLNYYSLSIDGLWGNGTKSGLEKFAYVKKLSGNTELEIFDKLLDLVDVPSSFAAPKKKKCDLQNLRVCSNKEFCKVAVYEVKGTLKFWNYSVTKEAKRRGLSCNTEVQLTQRKNKTDNNKSNNGELGKELLKLGLIGLACSVTTNPSACLDGATGSGSSNDTTSGRRTSSSNSNNCTSDFSCGIGKKCVKKPGSYSGICMTTVDQYGTKTYSTPSSSSAKRRDRSSSECTSNLDCPIGFKCDREYKVCVK